jgi:hypothetical protein
VGRKQVGDPEIRNERGAYGPLVRCLGPGASYLVRPFKPALHRASAASSLRCIWRALHPGGQPRIWPTPYLASPLSSQGLV